MGSPPGFVGSGASAGMCPARSLSWGWIPAPRSIRELGINKNQCEIHKSALPWANQEPDVCSLSPLAEGPCFMAQTRWFGCKDVDYSHKCRLVALSCYLLFPRGTTARIPSPVASPFTHRRNNDPNGAVPDVLKQRGSCEQRDPAASPEGLPWGQPMGTPGRAPELSPRSLSPHPDPSPDHARRGLSLPATFHRGALPRSELSSPVPLPQIPPSSFKAAPAEQKTHYGELHRACSSEELPAAEVTS